MMTRSSIFAAALLFIGVGHSIAQRVTVTWAGIGTAGVSGDNFPAHASQMSSPYDICIDAQKNLYVNGGNKVRRVDARTGVITTYAGGGSSLADGIPAVNASLATGCICLDAAGNLYLVSGNKIRKVDAITHNIATIAGTSAAGFSGDGGPAIAAQLSSPYGICTDAAGNIYVVDRGNARIRKIDAATGNINTIAGTGTAAYSGDGGPAIAAELANMSVLCVSNFGDIFFSDQNGTRIRRIDGTTGVISHIAGNGSGVYGTGNGGPAAVACVGNVNGICCNGHGDVFIDDDSCACRKIDMTTGIIDVVAGDMVSEGYNGDEGNALSKWFNWPKGVCVDADNNLYVADRNNNRIRKAIQLGHAPAFAYGRGQTITPCVATATVLTRELAVVDMDLGETETWTVVTPPSAGMLTGFPYAASSVGVSGVVKPVAPTYILPSSYVADDSFTVMVTDGLYADTVTIHVRMPAIGNISGPSVVCVGSSIALTESAPGGAWSVTGGNATISGTGDVSGLVTGVTTVRYTVSDALCGTAYAEKAVVVDSLPDPGVIAGAEKICVGATLLWTNTVTGGVWSSDNGNAVSASVGYFTGVSVGAEVIRFTKTNTCGSSVITKNIIVEDVPSAGTISAAVNGVCIGQTLTMTNTVSGGVWSVNNANAAISAGGVVTGAAAGAVTVQYAVTNTCGTNTASKDIVVTDCGTTGVASAGTKTISVYPNPASATLTVEWGTTTGQVYAVVADVTGKVVATASSAPGSSELKVDVSGLAEGMYLLTLKGDSLSETRKIVISRK